MILGGHADIQFIGILRILIEYDKEKNNLDKRAEYRRESLYKKKL